MTTSVRGRTLRSRLLSYITDATGRLRAAWALLTTAQTRLLNALALIRPGRTAGARIRAAVAAFNTTLSAFDRTARAFIERWAATDLPLIYREGAHTLLGNANRPTTVFGWTPGHQAQITALSAQYYTDLTGRLTEALRRARAFLRAAESAARARAARFDAALLRRTHPLDTVIYANNARHPVDAWARSALTWQAVTTANTGACRAALDDLGTQFVEVRDGPQCVMPGGKFLPHGHLKQMVRAWFSGPAYRITRRTSVGTDFITVGPNHPVLTERGWVRAHLLREGDQLVYDRLSEDPATLAELDLEQVPMVESVYSSLVKLLPVSVRPTTRHDLHSDGEFSQGEIQVVDVECSLLCKPDSSTPEHLGKDDFMRPDDGRTGLLGDGAPDVAVAVARTASLGGMCSAGTFFPGVGPGVRVPQRQSLGTTPSDLHVLDGSVDLSDAKSEKLGNLAWLASVFDVEASYLLTRDSAAARVGAVVATEAALAVVARSEPSPADLADGGDPVLATVQLPHRFSLSRIEEISVEPYEGWVYDATTSGGTFTIDGVIVANCGWTSHEDSDIANRTVRTVQDALAHPISHPHCVREFLPRLDIADRTDIQSGAPL
ncbi:hypothetical protein [Streptomyces sp. NPDC018584]|uniref:hypothetical protein n=1 Tax=unclassified Streptomyces TaxID=2593676 RepID=UPI0037B0817B